MTIAPLSMITVGFIIGVLESYEMIVGIGIAFAALVIGSATTFFVPYLIGAGISVLFRDAPQ